MQIKNSTYDIFYSFLFEDPSFREKVLSMIIEKDFISIELQRQELTTRISGKYLPILRVDFQNIIDTLDINKQKVLAEEIQTFVKKLNQPLQYEQIIYEAGIKNKIETKLEYETSTLKKMPNVKTHVEQVKLHIEEVKAYLKQTKIKSEEDNLKLEESKTQMEAAKIKSIQVTTKLDKVKIKSQRQAKSQPKQVKLELEREEKENTVVKKMLLSRLLSAEQISEFQNIPLQRVLEIQNKLNLDK